MFYDCIKNMNYQFKRIKLHCLSRWAFLVIFLWISFFSSQAMAMSQLGISNSASNNSSSSFKKPEHWQSFLGGAATTLIAHEAAHVLMAKSYDFDVSVDGVSIVYPNWDPTPQQKLRVASAGFQAQWLASEFAFNKLNQKQIMSDSRKKEYYQGMVAGHLAISLAYIALKEDERSDIYAMANATDLSRNQILTMMLIPAGLDAARLWMDNPPKWLQNASFVSKGFGVAAVWTF
jgi:hypothetical protein